MNQTRLESLIEALINVAIGFIISTVANAIILPLVGLPASFMQNITIGLFMTVISVARSYCIRRWADKSLRKFNQWVVNKLKGKKQ